MDATRWRFRAALFVFALWVLSLGLLAVRTSQVPVARDNPIIPR